MQHVKLSQINHCTRNRRLRRLRRIYDGLLTIPVKRAKNVRK
jgi:hypothetical protein